MIIKIEKAKLFRFFVLALIGNYLIFPWAAISNRAWGGGNSSGVTDGDSDSNVILPPQSDLEVEVVDKTKAKDIQIDEFTKSTHWRALRESRLGKKAVIEQNLSEAQEHFIRALSEEPFMALNHNNLGLTFDLAKEAQKAEASYRKVIELAQAPLEKFIGHFNLAQLLGRKGDIGGALEQYQAALEIVPGSKEVKVNIELLIQRQQQSQQNSSEGKEGQNQDGKNGDSSKENKQENSKDPNSESKDQKNKNQQSDPKDQKDSQNKDGKDKKDKKSDSPQKYQGNKNYQPRPFNGKELSEGDVKKILGELKQQEQRIRSNYYKKDLKETPNGKDW